MYLLSMCIQNWQYYNFKAIIHLKQKLSIMVYPCVLEGDAAADLYIEQDRLIYFYDFPNSLCRIKIQFCSTKH